MTGSHRRHRHILLWLALGLLIAGRPATADETTEGLILTVARAQALARQTLDDSVAPIGNLLNQIGPSCVFASGEQGVGSWSLAVGASASEFNVTSPDYTLDDPGGDDRIEGGIGAIYADGSIGLFRGYRSSGSLHGLGSVDLLLRLGFSLGDQEDLAEEIDLSSWGPILGGGLRIGLLKGDDVPAVSLAMGANFFERRLFTVLVEDEDAEVNLDFQQTSAFLLVEVGKQFDWVTPYLAGGWLHHRLEAAYTAEVVYGESSPATVHDDVDRSINETALFGGVELLNGWFRLNLEAGVSGGETYGKFFIRFTG